MHKEKAYLGQGQPGLKTEVVAPGIVTTGHMEFFGSLAPDGKHLFFQTDLGKEKAGIFRADTQVIENLDNQ